MWSSKVLTSNWILIMTLYKCHQNWLHNGQPVHNGIKIGFIMVSQCILCHQNWVYNGQPAYIMTSKLGL